MKTLAFALFIALLLAIPAQATNQVISYHNQVITAFDPYDYDCQQNVAHHNDVVISVNAGYQNVSAYAVSEPQYCQSPVGASPYSVMVKFMGAQVVSSKQVQVIVQTGLFRRLNIFRNQTIVNCVQVVKVNNKVVKQVVVNQVKVVGLFGSNARRVKQAVASCR